MKLTKHKIIIASIILSLNSIAMADNLPCGFEQVMQKAASANQKFNTPEALFNNVLFSKDVSVDARTQAAYEIDGMCKLSQPLSPDIDCTKPMYSYQALIEETKQYPQFACEGNLADRVRDVSAYLANVALETTMGLNYTNDGLYFRGENVESAPQYDPSGIFITSLEETTSYCMQGDGSDYSSAVYNFHPENNSFTAGQWVTNCPDNYNIEMTEILDSGNWYGHGPMQLTGDSIFLETTVYNNKHTDGQLSVPQYADGLLNNENIAWDSSLEYWVNSKPNQPNQPPPRYYVLSNNAGWGFGKSVYMVNGGCNQYDQRLSYFKYFNEQLSKFDPLARDGETDSQLTCG
jgi:hypothetical protein